MAYSQSTSSFRLELRQNGTERILEGTAIGGVTVSMGLIPVQNFVLSSFDVDLTSTVLFGNDIVDYELTVKVKNTLKDDGGIIVSYPAGFVVSRCWVLTNLVDLSETQLASCFVNTGLKRL